MTNLNREQLGSRLGFLLVSAGCAVGIGNVWRFPYITGKYGGAIFVLCYLVFLFILGLPIMVMEFSLGRAGRQGIVGSLRKLAPAGSKWPIYGYLAIIGNLLLMMFYTTVAGWMLAYFFYMFKGDLSGLAPVQVGMFFGGLLSRPFELTLWMGIVVLLGYWVCMSGLKKGVERISKLIMSGLFLILLALVVKSVSLPGAERGIAFYLLPDFDKVLDSGIGEVLYAAMGQAFFTLSLGIGALTIFGSYIDKQRSLAGESLTIILLDTLIAVLSGLIIFPACFAFGVNADSGGGLIFVTLPNVFNSMSGGRFWGALFFLFMCFAALSTVIAVFENIIAFAMEEFGWKRKKSSIICSLIVFVLSLPCVLGFNVWSGFQPLGQGSGIIDLEDFLVGNNLLPLGSLLLLIFCTSSGGWGWKRFIVEANEGKGMRFPSGIYWYVKFILPALMIFVFVAGYVEKFFR